MQTRGGRAAAAAVVALAIAGVVIGVVIWRTGGDDDDVPVAESFEMRLVSSTCDEDGDKVTIDGEVANVSQAIYPEVGVRGIFANATLQPLAEALANLGEMAPGDIKHFTLQVEQADVQHCSVKFFLPSGRELRTDESVLDAPASTPTP